MSIENMVIIIVIAGLVATISGGLILIIANLMKRTTDMDRILFMKRELMPEISETMDKMLDHAMDKIPVKLKEIRDEMNEDV